MESALIVCVGGGAMWLGSIGSVGSMGSMGSVGSVGNMGSYLIAHYPIYPQYPVYPVYPGSPWLRRGGRKNNKRQPFDCRLVTPTGFKPVTAWSVVKISLFLLVYSLFYNIYYKIVYQIVAVLICFSYICIIKVNLLSPYFHPVNNNQIYILPWKKKRKQM